MNLAGVAGNTGTYRATDREVTEAVAVYIADPGKHAGRTFVEVGSGGVSFVFNGRTATYIDVQ